MSEVIQLADYRKKKAKDRLDSSIAKFHNLLKALKHDAKIYTHGDQVIYRGLVEHRAHVLEDEGLFCQIVIEGTANPLKVYKYQLRSLHENP